jgi:hypothetical protein
MKKQSVFPLLLCSWIFGVSLICLFPPVPDYDSLGQESGSLSQESFPEIHQINTFPSSFFQLDHGYDFFGSLPDLIIDRGFRYFQITDYLRLTSQIPPFFNSWNLLKAFFETW